MAIDETVLRDSYCLRCGATLDPSWEYCQGCGAAATFRPLAPPVGSFAPTIDVPVMDVPGVPAADAPPKRHIITRRRALFAAAVVIVVALLTAGVVNVMHTRDDLAKTRAELASTQDELASTQGELGDTQADLATRTSERDTARDSLATAQADLAAIRTELSDANLRVGDQAEDIANLQSCLNGILNALDYASYGSYTRAMDELNAVEQSCESALEQIG